MPRIVTFIAVIATLVAAPVGAQQQLPPRSVPRPPPSYERGPMGPYISPMVSTLSAPVVRQLAGGTLTMVHAPAKLHVGTAYIALFIDDERGRPDAEAELSCDLYPPGEPDRGVKAFAWRAEPGRFLLREVLLREAGARELAVRIARPDREDEVEYFTLEIGEMTAPSGPLWLPGGALVPGLPHWGEARAETVPVPGGRLTMMHYPRQPRVGMIHFQFIVEGRPEWLSLNTGMFRAGVGDFYENLHLRKYGDGIYTGYARVGQPGSYLVRATLRPPGELGYTVQFEVRVRR